MCTVVGRLAQHLNFPVLCAHVKQICAGMRHSMLLEFKIDTAAVATPGHPLNLGHAVADLHCHQHGRLFPRRHRSLQQNVQWQTSWIAVQLGHHQKLHSDCAIDLLQQCRRHCTSDCARRMHTKASAKVVMLLEGAVPTIAVTD